uniref:glucan endo-1,3-beta-D-glucosidase n=1 Tax=Albugo laibachii Nc14 TaxID=890382 RepID=F0WCS3_9STRA|nr:glycoside hydrolase putative [Albugo laibachii Nc14]|eukprot:CCA18992.1 glycoside hydrolase putative [Albugo laibachii Nc14]
MLKYLAFLAALSPPKQTLAALGVCYDPYQRAGYTKGSVTRDFEQIAESFEYVRTFSAITGSVNLIECAATTDLKMNVGVQMNSEGDTQRDINAICTAMAKYNSTIHTISVGNENMMLDKPEVLADKMLRLIHEVKKCVKGTGIIVTTTQRIGDWLDYKEVQRVAAELDVIVANIYPFFSSSANTPIQRLHDQIGQIRSKYPSKSIQIGETGWPSGGEAAYGNTPTYKGLGDFFQAWVEFFRRQGMISYYFIMYDNIRSYTGKDHELHFGLCTKEGKPKVTMPKRSAQGAVVQSLPPNKQTLPKNLLPSPIRQGLHLPPAPKPAPKPAPSPIPLSPTAPKPAPARIQAPKPVPIPAPKPAPKPAPAPIPAPTTLPTALPLGSSSGRPEMGDRVPIREPKNPTVVHEAAISTAGSPSSQSTRTNC